MFTENKRKLPKQHRQLRKPALLKRKLLGFEQQRQAHGTPVHCASPL